MANNNTNKNGKKNRTFFKDFKAELKKVVWPTPKQVVNSTMGVVVIVLITAVIVFVLDFTFESFNKYGVNKLKGIVNESSNTSVQNDIANNNVDNTANNANNTVDNANETNTAGSNTSAE